MSDVSIIAINIVCGNIFMKVIISPLTEFLLSQNLENILLICSI